MFWQESDCNIWIPLENFSRERNISPKNISLENLSLELCLSRVGVPFLRPLFSITKYVTIRSTDAQIFEFAIVVEQRDLGF